jgi:hypothetical protein
MKTAKQMPETFTIALPQSDSGTYTYSLSSGKFADRDYHDPWVWVAKQHEELHPHFTCHANGFTNNFLTRFHMSMAYDGREGLHIWFNVNSAGIVKYTNVDGSRLQSKAQAAEQWVETKKTYFTQLAQSFVNAALLP